MAQRAAVWVVLATVACGGMGPEVRRAADRGNIPEALRLYNAYVADRGAGNADILSDVALGILREAARSVDVHVRASGFAALRSVGIRGRRVLEVLAGESGVVGDRASAALYELDGREGAPPARLATARASSDSERRVAGMAVLGAHDGAELLTLLGDADVAVRRAAATRLGRVHGAGVLQALGHSARTDREGTVRAAAVVALGGHGPEAVTPLVSALTDPDLIVRLATPPALMNASPDDAVEVLGGLLAGDPTDLSLEAARVLVLRDDARAVACVLAALSSPRPEIRGQAAVAAGMMPGSHATEIEAHLGDSDPEVVLRLAAALLRQGRSRDRSLAALRPLAAGPQPFLAIRALQALASAGDPSAAEPIREALTVTDAGVRRMAVLAWPDVVGSSGNVDPLVPLLSDPDRSVALMAAAEVVLIAGR